MAGASKSPINNNQVFTSKSKGRQRKASALDEHGGSSHLHRGFGSEVISPASLLFGTKKTHDFEHIQMTTDNSDTAEQLEYQIRSLQTMIDE